MGDTAARGCGPRATHGGHTSSPAIGSVPPCTNEDTEWYRHPAYRRDALRPKGKAALPADLDAQPVAIVGSCEDSCS